MREMLRSSWHASSDERPWSTLTREGRIHAHLERRGHRIGRVLPVQRLDRRGFPPWRAVSSAACLCHTAAGRRWVGGCALACLLPVFGCALSANRDCLQVRGTSWWFERRRRGDPQPPSPANKHGPRITDTCTHHPLHVASCPRIQWAGNGMPRCAGQAMSVVGAHGDARQCSGFQSRTVWAKCR